MISRRALAAWAGSDRIPIVAARLAQLKELPVTRASALLALFVAGVEVEAELLPVIDDELVERIGDRVRARVALLPIGEAVIVCDRADAAKTAELVCWPDDSSLHLVSSIPPGRRARWIDLGCGSAVAQLARPALADRLVASDLNPRAIRYAQLGARLSKIELQTATGDLAVDGLAELITCNAPIPSGIRIVDVDVHVHVHVDVHDPDPTSRAIDEAFPHTALAPDPDPDPIDAAADLDPVWRATDVATHAADLDPVWRATDAGFVARMFGAARTALAPRGLIVAHTALDAVPDLAGEVVTIAYTPPEAPRQFAITWWSPDAPARVARARRLLDPSHPHLDHRDRETALSGNLPAL